MKRFTGQQFFFTVAAIVIAAIAGYAIIRKHISTDDRGHVSVSSDVLAFTRAGHDLLEGNNIYYNADGSKNSYVYPPFYACLTIPLAFLPSLAVDIGWYVLNIFLIVPILAMGYILLTKKSFFDLPYRTRWGYSFLAIIFSLRYLIRNAQDANINLLLLFLILAGLYLSEHSSKPSGAILLGIAAAIKILPLIFIVYLIGRRRWKEFTIMISTFIITTFLPSMVIGIPHTIEYLKEFIHYSQTQFSPQGLEIENFSIWGTLGRLFSHNKAFEFPDGTPIYLNFIDAPIGILKIAVFCINVCLIALVYITSRRKNQPLDGLSQTFVNPSIVVVLLSMNLISILTEDHHPVALMIVYLYLMIVWKEKIFAGIFRRGAVICTGILSLGISYDSIVPLCGKYTYMLLLSYGLPVLLVELTLLFIVLPPLRSFSPTTSYTS